MAEILGSAILGSAILGGGEGETPGPGNARVSQVAPLVIQAGEPAARISQVVALVITDAVAGPARVSQVAPLVIQDGAPAARVSQVAPLAIQDGTPAARVSQVVPLVIQTPDPAKARVSQLAPLVIQTGTPKARVSQVVALAITDATGLIPIGNLPFTLLIGGPGGLTDRTTWLKSDTMDIKSEYNGRDSATFALESLGRRWRPPEGVEVIYMVGHRRLFGGFIQDVDEEAYNGSTDFVLSVSCVDYSVILEQRFFSKTYTGGSYDYATIMAEIVAVGLSGEGITYEAEETATLSGPRKLDLEGPTVKQAIEKLNRYFGFESRVTPYKRLTGRRNTWELAPYTIRDQATSENGVWRSMKVKRTAAHYRNRQGAKTRVPTAGQRQTTLPGNGTYEYQLGFALTAAPAVEVNGSPKSVVLYPPATGLWDFAYELNSGLLRHNPALTALTAADEITVDGPTDNLDIVWTENAGEISRRAALTGGSGIVECVDVARNCFDLEAALAFNRTQIQKLGSPLVKADIVSDKPGWEVGQYVWINTTSPLIMGLFMIRNLGYREIGMTIGRYALSVQAPELPIIEKIEIIDAGGGDYTVVIETTIPHGVDIGNSLTLTGITNEIGEGLNGGTWEIVDIPGPNLIEIEVPGPIEITPGVIVDGGAGGGAGGILVGIPPLPGGPELGGGSGIGTPTLIITNVNLTNREVTTSQPHGFTTSYPGPGGTRVAIWGVRGTDTPSGSSINGPSQRIIVTSPTTFIAYDGGHLGFGEPFVNDGNGRVAPTDQLVAVGISSNPALDRMRDLYAASQGERNNDYDRGTFWLSGQELQVQGNASLTWTVDHDQVVERISAEIRQAPEGGPAKFQVKRNGVALLNAPLEVPEGSTDTIDSRDLAERPTVLLTGDKVTIDVTEVPTGPGNFGGCDAVVRVHTRG